MMTNRFGLWGLRHWIGIVTLLAGVGAQAAPLTWFPGPSLGSPRSGSATALGSGGANLLIGGDSPVVQELAATNSGWAYLPSFYSLAIAPGVVDNGDLLLVYGGSDGTSSTATVIGYSPSGDASQVLHPMSAARSAFGYAPDANGNAYAIGGVDDSGNPLSTAETYQPDTDTWAGIAPLPGARYRFAAVFDGTNHLYTFGGLTDAAGGIESATVLRYSTRSNNWTAVTPMPVATADSAAALGADGNIYVVGGIAGGSATNVVQVYSLASNAWRIATPLPEAVSGADLGRDSLGRLVVMGGLDANGTDLADVWRSQQLGVPDRAPTFTQYPVLTNGGYPMPYASSIGAAGNPQPTYLLVSGPAGMQVDPLSGAISWTPQADQIGTNAVTLRATNYAGFADWSFTIRVAPPPPTVPTNLTVVSVSENSATFSWAPESPLVGAVSYDGYERHVAYQGKGGSRAYYVLVSSNGPNPSITLGGLATGSTHTYAVAAVAASGMSAMSLDLTVTTASPQPPANLRVTGLTSTSITLAWDPPPGPVSAASYEVWGWANNGLSSAIYGMGITNTTLAITGLAPGSSHEWGVRAHDAAGYASGFAYGPTVLNPVPVAPLLGGAGRQPDGSFQLTVLEVGPVVQTVLIQATTNPADPAGWVQIGAVLPASAGFTFTDTNAANFPLRFYRVVSP